MTNVSFAGDRLIILMNNGRNILFEHGHRYCLMEGRRIYSDTQSLQPYDCPLGYYLTRLGCSVGNLQVERSGFMKWGAQAFKDIWMRKGVPGRWFARLMLSKIANPRVIVGRALKTQKTSEEFPKKAKIKTSDCIHYIPDPKCPWEQTEGFQPGPVVKDLYDSVWGKKGRFPSDLVRTLQPEACRSEQQPDRGDEIPTAGEGTARVLCAAVAESGGEVGEEEEEEEGEIESGEEHEGEDEREDEDDEIDLADLAKRIRENQELPSFGWDHLEKILALESDEDEEDKVTIKHLQSWESGRYAAKDSPLMAESVAACATAEDSTCHPYALVQKSCLSPLFGAWRLAPALIDELLIGMQTGMLTTLEHVPARYGPFFSFVVYGHTHSARVNTFETERDKLVYLNSGRSNEWNTDSDFVQISASPEDGFAATLWNVQNTDPEEEGSSDEDDEDEVNSEIREIRREEFPLEEDTHEKKRWHHGHPARKPGEEDPVYVYRLTHDFEEIHHAASYGATLSDGEKLNPEDDWELKKQRVTFMARVGQEEGWYRCPGHSYGDDELPISQLLEDILGCALQPVKLRGFEWAEKPKWD